MSLLDSATEGRALLGAWCSIPSSVVAEAIGRMGFDWVCLDVQHGLISFESLVGMLQALAITDTPSFVRVAENSPKEIGQALDAGAAGIIVPMVNSREDALMAVRAARYPPDGARSWGATRLGFGEAGGTVRREALLLVMLETAEAFESARSIVSVPGIDGVFVGPSDLAMSLGLGPADVRDEEVWRRCRDLISLCRKQRIHAGIAAHSVDQANDWLAAGFRMVSIGRDLSVLLERMRERLDTVRGAMSRDETRPRASHVRDE